MGAASRRAKSLSVVALLLGLFSLAALAAPNFPQLTGRVVDQANILDAQTRLDLAMQLQQHETLTSNQLVVVTLAGLQGYDISEYGFQLARHWGIGQKAENNGALLIIAPQERKVRIEVGYGLEGALTDGLSQQIIQRNILPYFRRGNFSQGIVSGTQEIIKILELDPAMLAQKKRRLSADGKSVEHFFGIFIFIFILLSSFVRPFVKKIGKLGMLSVSGVVAGVSWWLTAQLLIALFAGFFCFLLLSSPAGSASGWYRGGGGTLGGGFGGGFGGGGGSFGGGGASGGW